MSVKQLCQAFEYYGDGMKYKHRFWRETNLTRILKSKIFVVECEQSFNILYKKKLTIMENFKQYPESKRIVNLPFPYV